MRVIKSLFRIVRWPAAVRAGALFLALLAIVGILIGTLDPEGMAKRSSPISIPAHACVLVAAILGTVGVRLFAWLATIALAGVAFVALPSLFHADLVGGLWGVVWIALFCTPAVFAFVAEFTRDQASSASPPS